ncbi:MAG: DNA mismatch repair endonuclease MutL [Anaerovoracaceae bacterium]|jgi:DNA mismatch repair protein MutL
MLQRNKINILPKNIADKIAAGEIVDRPLSIIKELLENAIDAGADSIIVEIKNGGKSYIRVTDNGCGIPKEEVSLAFQRHATSKILTQKDLFSINTLGFRGEALASIGAVSHIELITKTHEEKMGSRIVIQGSQIVEQSDTGCPNGTTVIVTNLFYNTPVRLKFLKNDAAESTPIIDFVSKMALAYPFTRIRLINNGSILFSTLGKGSIYTNILTIYSKELGTELLQIEKNEGDYSIKAYISPQNVTRLNRKYQVFFVNGRYIKSKVLDNAVALAYRERVPEGRYPVVFLFLSISPNRLDVNIHPNKQEIRFDDNGEAAAFVTETIRKGLSTKEGIPEIKAENIFKRKPEKDLTDNSIDHTTKSREEQVDIIKVLSTKQRNHDLNKNIKDIKVEKTKETSIVQENSSDYNTFDVSGIRITGSIFGTYITGIDDNNFYLVDQHAAHERILYERLLNKDTINNIDCQVLLSPFVIEIPLIAVNQTEIWLDSLKSMGFHLEVFGQRSYIVKGIPIFMDIEEAGDFLNCFMDEINGSETIKNRKKIDKIIMKACKSAVKSNDRLDYKEMKQLIEDLANTKNPFTCPHGRPTFIKLSKYEIEKLFNRV